MKYTTLLLDADNTIFDFDAAEHAALQRVMEERGIPFTAQVEQTYLTVNKALWAAFDRGEVTQPFLVVERFRKFCEEMGYDHDPVTFNEDYLTHLGEGSQLLPGALELCRDLAVHYRLALATNGVGRVQHARLAKSPLSPYIPHVFVSAEVGAQKPQLAFYQRIFEDLEIIDPATVLMIGDSLAADMMGGYQAGIDTLWYNPKKKPRPDHPPLTYEVASFQEMRQILLP